MEGLQRSVVSFRRQGSSGLVWDDNFLAELNSSTQQQQTQTEQEQEPKTTETTEPIKQEKQDTNTTKPSISINTIERSRSNGGQRGGGYRTGKVSPAVDPPSPKVSACGFCSVFQNPEKGNRKKFVKGRSR